MVANTEQRKYIRVPFKAVACLWPLKQDAKEIRCDQTRDISLKGIYCYSDIKFSVGTTCELELHFTDTSSKLVLFLKGRVVRTDEEGMGIKFEEMDLDSFFSLKNILNYNK
ncbi:MAG: PilZ domain-containing protein [Deltaproteobacteria bacterium]|nr:PilZ domain-containing protein [Deltaproteobacteria bacterium]